MNPLFKRVAGNTGLGLLSGVVILIAGIIRAGLLAVYLDLTEFGYFIICTNLIAFVRVLMQIGVADTIIRFFPKFEEQKRNDALSSLVFLIFYVACGTTLLVLLVACIFSGVIAQSWYGDQELATPILLSATLSSGFLLSAGSTALLRVQNQFHLAVLPPIIAACIGPLGIYLFHRYNALNLTNAVLAVSAGSLIATLGCVFFAALVTSKRLDFSLGNLKLKPLSESKREIRSTLTQTSLFGILSGSSEVGGIFLLGLLGAPAQVAILGMSVQLSRPFILVQSSLGTALSPEISRLHAERKHRDLYDFVVKFVGAFLVLVTVAVGLLWFFTPIIVGNFLDVSYLTAVPVFLILMISNGLMMAFQPCLPVAIAQGRVGRRNLAVCARFLYLGLACIPGLTAMGVALSILVGNLTVRITNDLPLLRRMRLAAQNA